MRLVLISVSIGIFDDILIPADAMQHPSRLYPFVMINRSHVKFSSASGLKASQEEVWLSGSLSSRRFSDDERRRGECKSMIGESEKKLQHVIIINFCHKEK